MGINQITEDLIKSLEELVKFFEMNDDGTGEPFMALGFTKDVVEIFQQAKQTLDRAKIEIG